MRNRDKRLDGNVSVKYLWATAKDYPVGFEARRPLVNYKKVAPFTLRTETKEFWANGAAKKNRTQGNEFVHDAMYKHGITCINCHNPHSLSNRADKPEGGEQSLYEVSLIWFPPKLARGSHAS